MVLTQATLAFGVSMTASLLALLVAAYGAKQYSRVTFISILIFLFVIPLGMHYFYLQLETYVVVFDWPLEVGSLMAYWSPSLAIFVASILGGVFGYFAGNYWGQDDISCLRCQLIPFILIFLLSIVIIFLP